MRASGPDSLSTETRVEQKPQREQQSWTDPLVSAREACRWERAQTRTRSFILQLCAKALEPSIFSECRFFMKASGSFQSFMSASSSSVRPTAGA